MRAVIYSRVSTIDRGQNPEVQGSVLRKYCLDRNWILVEEISDQLTGTNDKRPGLQRLLRLVRSRHVDVVIVAKLDRLARSLKHLIAILDEFTDLGITFISLGDQLDASTASGKLMLHLIGAFAEFEASLIRERTIAGIDYAKSQGKKLGRPISNDYEAIRSLKLKGLSHSAIRKQLGVSKGSIWRAFQAAPKSPSKPHRKTSMKSRGGHD